MAINPASCAGVMPGGGGAAGVATGVFSECSGFNSFTCSHDTFMNIYERNLLQSG